jgi:hypothetical protein
MAKLSKRIRKGVGRAARSKIATDILEDLIKAALIAAAAKIANSRQAKQAARKVERTVEDAGAKAKRAPPRRRETRSKAR